MTIYLEIHLVYRQDLTKNLNKNYLNQHVEIKGQDDKQILSILIHQYLLWIV